ncbi:MAG TPA: LysR family transcriptional regulator [Caulobacter sp.]|nr:LysR family transcriptional regulator [Caulobacter sp.]
MFDWDDLRVFIAAARAGSFGGASQRLSVDTTTVSRRVARLESAIKATLLIRSPAGLQLTAAGAELMEVGLNAESVMTAAGRIGQQDVVAGTVRISTAEGFGAAVMAPALPALAVQRPNLRIELAANAGFLSPSRREVDMAVTLSPPNLSRLVVEPLTPYQLGLYAAPAYLERVGAPTRVEDLSGHAIVGYVDDLLYAPELRYLEEVSPGLAPRLASSSIQAQRAIIAAGGGIGVLPCFLAEGLSPVLWPQVRIERRFWLSMHQEIHETARMRAVRAWLKALVAEQSPRLTPIPPRAEPRTPRASRPRARTAASRPLGEA